MITANLICIQTNQMHIRSPTMRGGPQLHHRPPARLGKMPISGGQSCNPLNRAHKSGSIGEIGPRSGGGGGGLHWPLTTLSPCSAGPSFPSLLSCPQALFHTEMTMYPNQWRCACHLAASFHFPSANLPPRRFWSAYLSIFWAARIGVPRDYITLMTLATHTLTRTFILWR